VASVRTTTSWAPIDLGAEPTEDLAPTVGIRSDGAALFYPGRKHMIQSEPESGKGWLALSVSVQLVRAGLRVCYIDFEDHAAAIRERLRSLGLEDFDRFTYIRPEEPLSDAGETDLRGALAESAPSFVTIDGVTEAMALHKLSPLDNEDVAAFFEGFPSRLAKDGAAVAKLDHVVKAREARGRYAIGAQHKLAGIDGAAYSLQTVQPFGRGLHGAARIEVVKDRLGYIRAAAAGGKVAGEFHLRSDPTGRVDLCEVQPVLALTTDNGVAPSVQRVRDVLARVEPPGIAVKEIGDRVVEQGWAAGLHRATIHAALKKLEELGAVDGADGRWWCCP